MLMTRRITRIAPLAVALLVLAAPATAQDAGAAARIVPLTAGWRDATELEGARGLLRDDPAGRGLIHARRVAPGEVAGEGDLRWRLVAPEVLGVWSSDIPLAFTPGSAWAGRGATVQLTAGGHLGAGPVTLTFAPELVLVENRDFDFVGSVRPDRSRFVAPWRIGDTSADLPVRFGDRSFALATPGQSTLEVAAGPLAAGASTASQWWGPGIRNAIVLSDNAGGIPHLFLRTATPLATPLGMVEAKWLIGGLSESLYFDNDPGNDLRSFSALAASLRLAVEPDLTLGLARAVLRPADDRGGVLGHAADALVEWESGADAGEPLEQILALYARWRFPESGLETHLEWARLELPRSLEDVLTTPNHTQGYTLGLQWARPVEDGARLVRLQAELTYLEQSATYRTRPTPRYYVSEEIPQGYTHRGKSIGAAIGPGASSQWLALDYFADDWTIGTFVTRVRWDNDAYYTQPPGGHYLAHDISVIGGVRGGRAERWGRWDAELAWEDRLNYLFQNPSLDFHAGQAVDVHNLSLRLRVTPGW